MTNQYKTELNFLSSAKYTVEDKKIMFIGSVTRMLYDYKTFKNNTDLKEYTVFFENYFKEAQPKFEGYKPYLFKSRTLLASRICRMIFLNEDSVGIRKLIDYHINFINNLDEKQNPVVHKRTTSKKSSLIDDFINENK